MFNWSLGFLMVALVAALLGFGGLAGTATEFARILFMVGIVLFIVSLVYQGVSGRKPPRI